MKQQSLAALVCLVVTGFSQAQEVIRPVPLARLYVLVENNTSLPIRFVISSANGAINDVLRPGERARIPYLENGGERILTVYGVTTKTVLSSRSVELSPQQVLYAIPAVVVPVPTIEPEKLPPPKLVPVIRPAPTQL